MKTRRARGEAGARGLFLDRTLSPLLPLEDRKGGKIENACGPTPLPVPLIQLLRDTGPVEGGRSYPRWNPGRDRRDITGRSWREEEVGCQRPIFSVWSG